MTKLEFVKEIGKRTGFTQQDIFSVINAMGDIMKDAIINQETLHLVDGLTVTGKVAKEAVRRNPRTGESVIVPQHTKPMAKFSPKLKEAVR